MHEKKYKTKIGTGGANSMKGGAKSKQGVRLGFRRYWAIETNRTGLIQVNRTGSVHGIYRGKLVFSFIFSNPFSLFPLPLSNALSSL